MQRFIICSLLLIAFNHVVAAEDAKPTKRPITEAEAILAVYHEDWGRFSAGEPKIILVAWPDGHIVWSADRLNGGPPYRTGQVDPKKVTALLQQFESDGLLASKELNDPHFGPDSSFTTVFVKSGANKVEMQSWHELTEESEKKVADHSGISSPQDQKRLAVLRKAPADYLFFRFVWGEVREKMNGLIPSESKASAGKPVMKAGILSWQD